jgi:hypothetical protein
MTMPLFEALICFWIPMAGSFGIGTYYFMSLRPIERCFIAFNGLIESLYERREFRE